MSIVLYGTDGCHLCDEAEVLIRKVLPASMQLKLVDIVDDDILYEKYQYSIPVLRNSFTEQILFWPFTDGDILVLIQANERSE